MVEANKKAVRRVKHLTAMGFDRLKTLKRYTTINGERYTAGAGRSSPAFVGLSNRDGAAGLYVVVWLSWLYSSIVPCACLWAL